jgi:D-hydroxyproline dehydrogenase subunit alpha
LGIRRRNANPGAGACGRRHVVFLAEGVSERERFELVVVGGGPAGLAAVLEARRAGVETCLVEAQPRAGGRLAQGLDGPTVPGWHELVDEVTSSGAELNTETVAWGIWGREISTTSLSGPPRRLLGDQVILATGASERTVVLPGWTLPGVITAGAARQPVGPRGRVLVAGYGPWLESIVTDLRARGANLIGVVDAGAGLLVLRAEGDRVLQRAVIAEVDADWRPVAETERTLVEVDTLVLAFGNVVSSELSRLAECQHKFDDDRGGLIAVRDTWMRTSRPGVLVAGDAGGVVGPAIAVEQGRLAGLGAAVALGRVDQSEADGRALPIRQRLAALNDAWQPPRLGAGVFELADPHTIVCRCENVTRAQITAAMFDGTAELGTLIGETRAGMGRCQARDCARQVAAIVSQRTGRAIQDVPPITPRPPAMPVRLGALAQRPPALESLADLVYSRPEV